MLTLFTVKWQPSVNALITYEISFLNLRLLMLFVMIIVLYLMNVSLLCLQIFQLNFVADLLCTAHLPSENMYLKEHWFTKNKSRYFIKRTVYGNLKYYRIMNQ